MAYIYKIFNDVNDKLYIGKTSSTIEERFKQHISDSKKERHEKRPLYDAMKKYGIDKFHIEKIEEVENDEIASEREIYWINKLRTYIGFNDCNGYNATLGGDSKRYYNYEEIAKKYLELKNQRKTAEYFNCDTLTVRNACKELNIEIISGQEQSQIKLSKRIAQIDKNTNEIICVYPSISEAFRQLGKMKSGGISKVCNGKAEIYLGYKWKYI